VCAVADASDERCREAVTALGCRGYGDLPSLLGNGDVELVVIATPSHVHAQQTIEALERGKHVVCEKPMAMSTEEADRMIDAAQCAKRLLSVFQNMRFWEDFQKVREVIDSGVLGRIVQIKITMHRFTRRWDWQTLREFGGGHLFNGCAHLVDLGLQLFGPHEPTIMSDLQRTLTSGDAEDHAKIVLRAEGAPTIEIEVTNACAYAQETWHVMGTAGGLHGSNDELQWKWVDFSSMPQRPVEHAPAARNRRFNREELVWQESNWRKGSGENPDYRRFYTDVYQSLRHGAPLVITPQSVRRTLSVLERCRVA
jgi:scyllo-inositol 2-dehydrogenase (NADP+)